MASEENTKLRSTLAICLSVGSGVTLNTALAVEVGQGMQQEEKPANAKAKPTPAKPARAAGQVSRPPVSRWKEDFSSFADPANRKGFWAPIKYIPMGDSGSFLTLGGEYRLLYSNFFDNPGFGLNPPHEDDYFQQRAMFHANLTLGSHVRIYTELGDSRTWGKQGAVSTTDQSRTDLQQAFIDVMGKVGDSSFTLRAGRQEFDLGSSRIIGVRDAPNTRRSFDGARAMFKVGDVDVSMFWSYAVLLGPDSFDDNADRNNVFKGVYATKPLTMQGGNKLSLDMFWLDYQRDRATYSGVSGEEDRKSLGLRLFGNLGAWDVNWEGLYQYGDFNGGDIDAWGIATDTGYTFEDVTLKPRLGARLDIATGDDSRTDNKVNTFNPMYPRNSWYTLASLSGWSNIKSINPILQLQPHKSVKITTGVDYLWRESENDAVYLANMVVAPRTTANTEKRIGTAYLAEINWAPTPGFTLVAQYVYFDIARAIELAGGGNTNFFTVYGTYRF